MFWDVIASANVDHNYNVLLGYQATLILLCTQLYIVMGSVRIISIYNKSSCWISKWPHSGNIPHLQYHWVSKCLSQFNEIIEIWYRG